MRRFEHKRYGAARMASLTLALALALAVTGCSGLVGQASGELGRLQSLATGCPETSLLSVIDKDVSGSQDDAAIEAATLAVVRSVIEQAVACAAAQSGRGHVSVRLFATNATQTATLLDAEVVVDGATGIARLRRAVRDQLAEGLFARVSAAYPDALARLPVNGSDVMSRFELAGEAEQQLEQRTGQDWALNLMVITDGFASTPKGLSKVKTAAEAQELAQATVAQRPPQLDGAWRVALVGVGRTAADKQPSTARIEAVKAFWRVYLEDVADQVVVATDLPGSLSTSAAGEGR